MGRKKKEKKQKYKFLSLEEICNIVVDTERKPPENLRIRKVDVETVTLMFGWFETIQSAKTASQLRAGFPKIAKRISEMETTEAELDSFLYFYKKYQDKPDSLHYCEVEATE